MTQGPTGEQTASGPVSFSLEGDVLTVRDEAGGGEIAMEVDGAASLTPATDAWFNVPIDDAVSVETTEIEVRQGTSTQIRTDDGEHYGSILDGEFTVGGGTYVDIDGALKLLLYVEEGPMEGSLIENGPTPGSLLLTFEKPTRVVIGARSHHEQPVATMTVTDDPEDLMTAASYLGSSIKEWSAERSWPTLRGHPPGIEYGDELHIPDSLSKPGTEVTVAVPRDIGDVLRVMPLAHYFGADVVPGEQAELRLGAQHVEPLGSGQELEQSVDDLLGHALVLDSLVRIGGYYSMPRYEYDELAAELPFYPPELYDQPIHRQLLEYLEVSFETVAPYVSTWPAVGTLRPTADDAETVPYLLNTLLRVHVTDDGLPREPSTLDKPVDLACSLDVPPGVAAFPPAARERASRHDRRAAGEATLLFVGEDAPGPEQFDGLDWERFELGGTPTVDFRRSVSREELRSLLAEPYAYVHYGDQVTEEGFVCSDGVLAFEDLPDGGVGAISFEWPRAPTASLVGIHDVATVACLFEESADADALAQFGIYLAVGRSVATSADLAGVEHARCLGDATLSMTRRPTGHAPLVYDVRRQEPDAYEVLARLDTDQHDTLGQIIATRLDPSQDRYQLTGTVEQFDGPVSAATLADLVAGDTILEVDWRPTATATPPSIEELLSE
ncbi:hypothetical protein [Halolamina salifodinae]|uniref:Uncharacterized protein n=1 Tax=Halolamina salifodinae TaxID=1202767 RepID=A0A8T4GYJ8_9EURY|nr:hypothetical protein [Halolamina salifodinae]MBP1986445.1 hypothetical protein [Halolamina salifodinae]